MKVTGISNHLGARIPLDTRFNIPLWRELISEAHADIVDNLEYGFALGQEGVSPGLPPEENHRSALEYTGAVDDYLSGELSSNTLLGPFQHPPFPNPAFSPLMSAPKKLSNDRRVILDLSFPKGLSVNDITPRYTYMGLPFKLTLPTPLDFRDRLLAKGKGSYMFSVDLSSSYRQLRLCPLSWPYLGLQHHGWYYFDKCPPFGARFGAKFMQETSQAALSILEGFGVQALAYIDDFGGVRHSFLQAQQDFAIIHLVFNALGIQIAHHKSVPPCKKLTWLGVQFDSDLMVMSIPQAKLQDLVDTCTHMASLSSVPISRYRSLMGKLLHASYIVHDLRLFVNRLLQGLWHDPPSVLVTTHIRLDLDWLASNLPTFKPQALMRPPSAWDTIHVEVTATSQQLYIGHRLMDTFDAGMTSILALKIIHKALSYKCTSWYDATIDISMQDASEHLAILKSGRSRSPELVAMARQIWSLTAPSGLVLNIVDL